MSERHIPSGELVRLEADLLAIAHATGIVYEPDTGPCWPGPTDEIVKAIKDAVHEAREADSLRARIAELEDLLVTQTVDDIANIIDADGAQKARSESLAAERDFEHARAERYFEAMRTFVEAWHKHPVTVWAEPVSLAADALWNLVDKDEREWLK